MVGDGRNGALRHRQRTHAAVATAWSQLRL